MKILLVSATFKELELLVSNFELFEKVNERTFLYRYKGHTIYWLISGVGMVFTTFYLTKILTKQKFDLLINAGVAGAIDRSIKLGTVVNIISDFIYDLGAEDNGEWLPAAEIGLITNADFPYTVNGIEFNKQFDNAIIKELPKASGITVNRVHGNEASVAVLKSNCTAQVESMEGAAFMYCCAQFEQTAIQVRAISNYVEARNRASWEMGMSIKNLNDFLLRFFDNL